MRSENVACRFVVHRLELVLVERGAFGRVGSLRNGETIELVQYSEASKKFAKTFPESSDFVFVGESIP